MSRGLSGDMITEITAPALVPIILVKAEFDSGTLRFWSGIGNITFNSETYTGAGNLLGVSDIQEVIGIEARGANFSLSGISSSLLSIVLAEEIQSRPITCWFGCLNTSSAIVSSPFILFKGRMDTAQINDSGDFATISVNAENRLIDLKRPNLRRYTPEDQKVSYPADLGLNFVSSLQEMNLTWGRATK